MADSNQPTPGAIAVIAGGVVALIGSFLDFAFDTSAWGSGAFPIVTLIPVYCVVAALLVALPKYANVKLPSQIVGIGMGQLNLALGFFAALMSVFWLIAGDELGIGFWLMLIGSIATAVGAFMENSAADSPAIG